MVMGKQEEWTPEQFNSYMAAKSKADANAPRLKYGNKPSKVDGIQFDSLKEAEYYGKLKLLVRCGELLKIEVHKIYKLVVNGVKIGSYEADFVTYSRTGVVTVIDVKSVATEGLTVFRMKKALMLALYGIEIKIA